MSFPDIITELIDYFEKLPGIGPKTAQRLVFYLLNFPERDVKDFGKLISELKDRTQMCEICRNVSEEKICKICSDTGRNKRQILVVTNPLDVVALEKTSYEGVYHVLHGLIDPLSYIGPDDIYLDSLIERLEDLVSERGVESAFEKKDVGRVSEKLNLSDNDSNKDETFIEVVLATNASMEGESTAHYIRDLIREKGFTEEVVKITRIGRGLPVGGDIEYADDNTLSRALDSRR